MAQFEPVKAEIEAAGAQVVFIAAEKRSGMFKPEQYLKEHLVPYPFLLDEDRQVTKRYGVYQRIGVDALNIARPATMVVDRNGGIRFLYVGSNQADRAPLNQVIRAARGEW